SLVTVVNSPVTASSAPGTFSRLRPEGPRTRTRTKHHEVVQDGAVDKMGGIDEAHDAAGPRGGWARPHHPPLSPRAIIRATASRLTTILKYRSTGAEPMNPAIIAPASCRRSPPTRGPDAIGDPPPSGGASRGWLRPGGARRPSPPSVETRGRCRIPGARARTRARPTRPRRCPAARAEEA